MSESVDKRELDRTDKQDEAHNSKPDTLEDILGTLNSQIKSTKWLDENTPEKFERENPELARQFREASNMAEHTTDQSHDSNKECTTDRGDKPELARQFREASNMAEHTTDQSHDSVSVDECTTDANSTKDRGDAIELLEQNDKMDVPKEDIDQNSVKKESLDVIKTLQSNTTEDNHSAAVRDLQATESEAAVSENPEADGWMDVLGNGLLKMKKIKPGDGIDTRPLAGQLVTISCSGQLDNGSTVDTHEALTFILQDSDVITGFDLCIALMELDEVSQIIMDPKYAYGKIGREADIPPDATITYYVQLTKVQDGPQLDKLSTAERISMGDQKRDRGNYLFARQDYSLAINVYSKAIKIVDNSQTYKGKEDSEQSLDELLDVRVKCHNNLAAAQLKVEAYDATLKSCSYVLQYQPENVKALFRRGKAYLGKGEVGKAEKILRYALKHDPESKIIQNELSRIVNKRKAEDNREKKLYQKMLGTQHLVNENKGKESNWVKWGMLGAVVTGLLSVSLVVLYRTSSFHQMNGV